MSTRACAHVDNSDKVIRKFCNLLIEHCPNVFSHSKAGSMRQRRTAWTSHTCGRYCERSTSVWFDPKLANTTWPRTFFFVPFRLSLRTFLPLHHYKYLRYLDLVFPYSKSYWDLPCIGWQRNQQVTDVWFFFSYRIEFNRLYECTSKRPARR